MPIPEKKSPGRPKGTSTIVKVDPSKYPTEAEYRREYHRQYHFLKNKIVLPGKIRREDLMLLEEACAKKGKTFEESLVERLECMAKSIRKRGNKKRG